MRLWARFLLVFILLCPLAGISAAGIPSGLSEREMRIIAGLDPEVRVATRLGLDSAGKELSAKEIFSSIVAYVVSLNAPVEGEPWPNLAEKRYSFFRDLLTYIKSVRPDWNCHNRRLSDGTYVFNNGQVAFAIRGWDGGLFRSTIDLRSLHRAHRFEDLRWTKNLKRWDEPKPARGGNCPDSVGQVSQAAAARAQ